MSSPAAYNAGPKRVLDGLAKKADLAAETVGYVKTVTGRPVETWRVSAAGGTTVALPRQVPYRETVPLRLMPLPPARPIMVVAVDRKKITHHKLARQAASSGKSPEAKSAKTKSARSSTHDSKRKKQRTEQIAARQHRHKK